jgi:hypothetical protein
MLPCQTEDQLSDSQNYRQEQRQACHQDLLMCPVVDSGHKSTDVIVEQD